MKYTDAEVWEMIADTMEMSAEALGEEGLCLVLSRLVIDGVIRGGQKDALSRQLFDEYGHLVLPSYFFWKPGHIKPRIAACRKLAKLARKNER